MKICIFSSIWLVNKKNLLDKDCVFILPLLDLYIASNLYYSVINLLTIQSINVEKEHIN